MHRDVMAGHNICNVVRGHLFHQERPLYLQPVDEKGNHPLMSRSNASCKPLSDSSSTQPIKPTEAVEIISRPERQTENVTFKHNKSR
jgi:hypothetical protein